MLLASGALLSISAPGAAETTASSNPFCSRLGQSIQASAGAQMFCFGPLSTRTSGGVGGFAATATPFSPNVDAADPAEDVSPAGVQAYGQSETSVASVGPYVVEAWNDATGFFTPCPAPMHKDEFTGYGFSADGGASFVDEGGLPNGDCSRALFGDPSVEAWRSGGDAYFYVGSLYDGANSLGKSFLTINACKATGSGSSAKLRCGRPIVVAESTECTPDGFFCSFLDKDFLSIDPKRGRLYMSYTDFGISESTFNGRIELAVCDIGTRNGDTGPAGGTAGHPVCEPGRSSAPYLVVQPADRNCENEGAYPAVDVATGDVYVAWEFNWATNVSGACIATPTKEILKRVPFSCLTLTPTAACSGPANGAKVNVVSLDAAFIPGYNRFPANDFPRIAVDDAAGTVSLVWNDARYEPLGDILLKSFALGTLDEVQPSPVRLNANANGLHFLPAVRNASQDGTLQVSWYERSSPNTAVTDVEAALGIDPRLEKSPAANTLVTTVPTDWNAVSSDIVPNFGDYTDNYVIATGATPYTGDRVFVAWSDGRLGLPQPFEANAPAG